MFDSEEKARAREQDSRRQERSPGRQGMMADILDGPPEFVDLVVEEEWTAR